MKILRATSLILLLISLFVTIDFGINLIASLVGSMNDGIGNFSTLHYLFGIFGDNGWSHRLYFEAFQASAWISFFLFAENIVLSLINLFRKA